MTEPLSRPKRKNPLKKTRVPLLPQGVRSRTALGLTAAAAEGRFRLQVCDECAAVPDARIGLVSGFGMVTYDRGLASGAALLAGGTA